MVLEEDVGITCYADNAPGFAATLKHRYSDFCVNEVRLDGSVVRLVDSTVPKSAQASTEKSPACSAQELIARFEAQAGVPAPPELMPFLERVAQGQASASERVTLGSFDTKVQRTAVHGVFKAWPALASETSQGNGIEVGLGGGRGIKRRRSEWAGGDARYVKFTLYKENMESQAALSLICRKLGLSSKVFGVAGTKDKRGCTTQEATAFRVDPARLAAAATQLRGMRVGDFRFVDEELHLGQLKGNRFGLILRGVPSEAESTVRSACAALESRGFVNYFGLQRFGSGPVATHAIGRALLAGSWDEAVAALLSQNRGGSQGIPTDPAGIKAALRHTPSYAVAETAILQALLKHGATNYLTAIRAIPRNLRSMYIHAYQSFLWNMAVSFRLEQAKDKVLAGDLVALTSEDETAGNRGAEEGEEADAAGGPAAKETPAPPHAAPNMEVHCVTNEEAEADAFSMFDLVLPLPGSNIRYPDNSTAEVYERLAAEDGLSLSTSAHGSADFSLAGQSGAYRRVVARAGDLEWEVLHHSDLDAELAGGRGTVPDGPLLALRLAFTLGSSSYATMLVRELTKQPGAALHAPLSRPDTRAEAGSAEG